MTIAWSIMEGCESAGVLGADLDGTDGGLASSVDVEQDARPVRKLVPRGDVPPRGTPGHRAIEGSSRPLLDNLTVSIIPLPTEVAR